MEQVDPKEIRTLRSSVAQALSWLEENPSAPQAEHLRNTAAQARQQLSEWAEAGAYESFEVLRLRDQVAHVDARLVLARQQRERGY
jgi:hypothetical protein